MNLRVLHLANNNITHITDAAFLTLTSLQELYLGSNAISAISSLTFLGLISLRVLDLSYNVITTIDANAFAQASQLECLLLTHNGIIGPLPPTLLLPLSHLTILTLSRNPLTTVFAPNTTITPRLPISYLYDCYSRGGGGEGWRGWVVIGDG